MAATPALPATELVTLPATGRRYRAGRSVRLSDVDRTGRLRFDAIARYLQDVASDDAAAVGLDEGWVVRRTQLTVARSGVLGERVELTTFCSGTGRVWAERRTSISGDRGAAIEAVSLWIHVDVATGRPAALGERFFDHYGEAAGDRRVSARLVLPPPDGAAVVRAWPVRAVDLDPLGHVNNASQWAILEDVLPGGSRRGTAELEHVLPVDAGAAIDLVAVGAGGAVSAWLVGGGRVHTAARWRPDTRSPVP